MEWFSRLLLHLPWDTLVFFLLLRFALRDSDRSWRHLGTVCVAIAVWKAILYSLMNVFSLALLFLSIGIFLHWAYELKTRAIVSILAIYLMAGIFFGAILHAAHGVLDLFFI